MTNETPTEDTTECPRCGKIDLREERKLANNVAAGAAAGALAGSILPGLGTITGAVVGTAAAYFASEEVRPRYKCGHCEYTWGNYS